ncbi:MAG: signal peptidase II [Gammaproteobacteria bacterium]
MMKWYGLSLLVIVLDQLSKQFAEAQLVYHKSIAVFPGFNFTLMYNEGAAFSFLSDAGGWQRWFFTVLSVAISIVLIVWIKRLDSDKRILAAGLALILGGAIGNVIDRILFGHVIDFIDVYYQSSHWPAFNIADSAITLGACLLILDMFQEHKTNG